MVALSCTRPEQTPEQTIDTIEWRAYSELLQDDKTTEKAKRGDEKRVF